MGNPWDIDDEDIPTDPRARRHNRRLRVVGVVLWGVVIGTFSVIFVTDVGDLTAIQGLLLGAVGLVIAVVAVLLMWLVGSFLGGFGFGGRILLGLVLFFVLLAVVPPLLSMILEEISVFDDLQVDGGGLIELLFDLLR